MIRVNDDYIIEADKYSFTALFDKHKTYKDKDGNDINAYETIGHYSSIENAIKAIINSMFIKNVSQNDMSLEESLKKYAEITSKFSELISNAMRIEQ